MIKNKIIVLKFTSILKGYSIIAVLSAMIFCCKNRISQKKDSLVLNKEYCNPISPQKIKVNLNCTSVNSKSKCFFRENINRIYGEYYLTFVDDSDHLIFCPVFKNDKEASIPIENYLDHARSAFSLIVTDTAIFSYVKHKSLIYTIHFGRNFKITRVDSLCFVNLFDSTEIYIKENLDQPFQVIGETYFFPIGSLKKEKKFINEYSYLAINSSRGKVAATQILLSPHEYLDGLRKNMVTFIYQFDSSKNISLYQDIDRVIFFSKSNHEIVGAVNFNPYSSFEDFDYSQRKDLGYVRVYTETNEVNFAILRNSETTIIIKRVRRNDIYERTKFEYLVLNERFKLKNYDSVNYSIKPFLSFAYKNGFVLVDNNMKDAYYYETF